MTQHATLSASGAAGWMRCYGKLAMEKGKADRSSSYARWGTACHELAAWCLENNQDASSWAGRPIEVEEDNIEADEEMVSTAQTYVDIVRALGGFLMVEQRVDFSRWIGVPNSFGTSDAIVVLEEQREVCIVDLKSGRGVEVSAEENEQAQLYALGSLELVSLVADVEDDWTVRLMIVQPRIGNVSEWPTTVGALKDFAAKAAIAARHAIHQYDGKAEPKLNPGEKQCRFCKAKATCPALAAEVRELVSFGAATAEDFSDLTVDPTGIAGAIDAAVVTAGADGQQGDVLARAMAKVDLVKGWCKAVRAEVESRLVEGKPVEGFKLVQGRKGPRSWVSKDEAEVVLSSLRLKKDEMYDFSIISPTTAEKLFKAGTIGKRQWPKVQAIITQSEGKPSVAPASDKRPAITVAVSAEDFSVVTDDASDLA